MLFNIHVKKRTIYALFQQLFKRNITVLGIETSCDDTGAGIVNDNKEVLGECINSQTSIHVEMGGILPPVARDLHAQNIHDVVNSALLMSKMSVNELDAIAVTVKPGLSLSLTVGLNYAKQLALKYRKPLIPIHHMESHALTIRLTENVAMPYLALLISGGHALIALVNHVDDFWLLGKGLDDAPGEVLDKIARKLRLKNHPMCAGVSGGRAIEIMADLSRSGPIPDPVMSRWSDCNFSFSGIKNWAMNEISRMEAAEEIGPTDVLSSAPMICHQVQEAMLRHIAKRVQRALIYCQLKDAFHNVPKVLVISGGVASNSYMRNGLATICSRYDCRIVSPPIRYCTDNGVMIAWNGVEKLLSGYKGLTNYDDVSIQPKCPLGEDKTQEVRDMKIKLPYFKIIV